VVNAPYEPDMIAMSDAALDAATEKDMCTALGKIWQKWNDVAFSLDIGVGPNAWLVAPWVKNYRNFAQDALLEWLSPGMEEVFVLKH
jgi:hypothetical protein